MKLPKGYSYAATYAGIRKTNQNDLALIVSETPASTAGVFTRNQVKAAPVRRCQAHLAQSKGVARAILVNAGNANCATPTADRVALACCRALAKTAKIPLNQILPASTGVIGVDLEAGLITAALPELWSSLSADSFEAVSRAIMTTDTRPKTATAEVGLGGGVVNIAGMTKGAGMIQPNMATTLCFVMTDAGIGPAPLRGILRDACEGSFHRLSVDGDTSTNDTAIVMANGASGARLTSKDREMFAHAVMHLMQDLARQIARDGEGARKLITILVEGTKTNDEARRMAQAIANSPLVKTAIAGSDPNWGRILSAAGNSGVAFDPLTADIFLQDVRVCRRGVAASFSELEMKSGLDAAEVKILLRFKGNGGGQARYWTCDLTEEYIRINASYRT